MAQKLKIKPAGRRSGYHWTAEQREEIRQRTLKQCAERKEKRQQKARHKKNCEMLDKNGFKITDEIKIYNRQLSKDEFLKAQGVTKL